MAKPTIAPFVCSVGGSTFIIRFNEDHELHVFTCKDDKSLNWTEKLPAGTSDPKVADADG